MSVLLLDDHLRHCVRDAVRGESEVDGDTIVTEATEAIERLLSPSTTLSVIADGGSR